MDADEKLQRIEQELQSFYRETSGVDLQSPSYAEAEATFTSRVRDILEGDFSTE